jgi:acetoin utilization deacetylase AcuC-like enzyme
MRVFHSPNHLSHAPDNFIARGRVMPCPEQPRRAYILHAAAKRAGHQMITAEFHGLAPVRAIHETSYLKFLERAWELWSALPDAGSEIIPNVIPVAT